MYRIPGSERFSPGKKILISLALTYLGILDGTSDVERCFARVQLLELKRRVREFRPILMKDALQIATEVPSHVGALVRKVARPIQGKDGRDVTVLWRPSPFLLKAQRKYVDFFG